MAKGVDGGGRNAAPGWFGRRAAEIRSAGRWISARPIFKAKSWEGWAEADDSGFIKDVLVRPSVGGVASTIIVALVGLIAYLTWEYAGGGVHKDCVPCAERKEDEGVISLIWGYYTVLVMSLLAWLAGLEHIVWPRVTRWLAARRRDFDAFRSQFRSKEFGASAPKPRDQLISAALGLLAGIVWFIGWLLRAPFALLAFAVSAVDWFLARCVAVVAGAARRPTWKRYGQFALFVIGGGLVAYFAPTGGVAPWGVVGASVGILAVFGVARRWSWIERDRESFLIARRSVSNSDGVKTTRIGFAEDLRDEALFGITALFVLTPLLLRQIDLEYDAFDVIGPNGRESGTPGLWAWIGFFGGELVKSVPLVDWSEVFNVENESPIKPRTELGAQLIFAVRMTLDLLLIASVLLAVSIAGRLRDREAAFEAGDLDILDPFAELREFRAVGQEVRRLAEDPLVGYIANPALERFASYRPDRLTQIALGACPKGQAPELVLKNDDARIGALAALGRISPDEAVTALAKGRDGATLSAEPLFAQADPLSAAAKQLAFELKPNVSLDAMAQLLGDSDAKVARKAAWRLGLVGAARRAKAVAALQGVNASAPAVATQIAMALARQGVAPEQGSLERLAHLAEAGDASAKISAALVLTRAGADELGASFGETVIKAARLIDQIDRDDFVTVPGGAFQMGFAKGQRETNPPWSEWDAWATPQTTVEVRQTFELSRYAARRELFEAFVTATGRDVTGGAWVWNDGSPKIDSEASFRSPGFKQKDDHPAVCVSWLDAIACCRWLSQVTGAAYRLPTEAEWEWACRGGDRALKPGSLFWWGDDAPTAGHANYNSRFAFREGAATTDYRGGTVAVHVDAVEFPKVEPGTASAHPLGLHHMVGNCWEWCQDPWREEYGDHDGSEAAQLRSADLSQAVLRGGSWGNSPQYLRSANRGGDSRVLRYIFFGFRVARTLVE